MPPREPAAGLRRRMAGLHTWAGLLLGWLSYAVVLTGALSFFREELSVWMRPEASRTAAPAETAVQVRHMAAVLAGIEPPPHQWILELADGRRELATAIWIRGADHGERRLRPGTGAAAALRDTRGGDFFYRFHYQLHHLPHRLGRWIVGACAMGLLVLLISGVVLHRRFFADFFTLRLRGGQRSWLDAHNVSAAVALPFHFLIVYSGLVMLMFQYLPWGSIAAYPLPQERRAALLAQTDASVPLTAPRGTPAALQDLGGMVRLAEARWGRDGVSHVIVNNPADASALVTVVRSPRQRLSSSPQYLLFDGVGGSLLRVQEEVGPVAQARGILYALHMGRFADPLLRWLYFLSSLLCAALVWTGLVLWVAKRSDVTAAARPAGWHAVRKLNVAGLAGLSVAIAAFLWSNRLLPLQLPQRGEWEVQVFFAAWGLSVVHALLRPAAQAWREQLGCAAALLVLLPAAGFALCERHLFAGLRDGDWVFVGVESTAVALGLLHGVAALRAGRASARQR